MTKGNAELSNITDGVFRKGDSSWSRLV